MYAADSEGADVLVTSYAQTSKAILGIVLSYLAQQNLPPVRGIISSSEEYIDGHLAS